MHYLLHVTSQNDTCNSSCHLLWLARTDERPLCKEEKSINDIIVTINTRCLHSIAVWNESTNVLIQYKPNKNLICFIYFHLFRTYITCFIFNQLFKLLFAPQSITIRKFCRVSLNQYNVIHLSICIKVQHIPSMTVPVHFVFV